MTSIVLFRNDLRLDDHPAFAHAVARGPVLPVFLSDPREERGAAYQWWQRQSLRTLETRLAALSLPLVCRRGNSLETVQEIVEHSGADAVLWNRRYAKEQRDDDARLKDVLRERGVQAESFAGDTLCEPWKLLRDGAPYKVFSPFWKRFLRDISVDAPFTQPQQARAASRLPASEEPDSWGWEPKAPDWASRFLEHWQPGEDGASARLEGFIRDNLAEYAKGRDYPAAEKVSRLSPHLAHGEISPRRIWQRLQEVAAAQPELRKATDKFLAELGWREFSWHLLYHFPELPHTPLRAEFAQFSWAQDDDLLRAWQHGRTGYPIVDAGMRELWQTGYLHNRVRMIVGSFLVKDLLLPWQQGAAWFWDTLVDACPASNNASWQWVAGCGTDAAPYFRVFNPVLQAQKFDDDGHYQRRWLPELAALPNKLLPEPWSDPGQVQAKGIKLGQDYPLPLVDHHQARERALAAFATIKTEPVNNT
ncbi:DNA photolyase family protein [Acidithiobacillus sp. YTS05]|uniref:cryptochrome/photolyase family protein n=1 Tax=Igneacidithiobacillus copahuensis TaxID=2724909 RepID=UPI002107A606|nr:DNA photolyase family protein [Acidithiobacillus sp. YTS05]